MKTKKGAITFFNFFAIMGGWIAYILTVPFLGGMIDAIKGTTGCDATCQTFLSAIPVVLGVALIGGTIWIARSPEEGMPQ
jgi:hypothetical protein